jgi:hypothetical protein
MTNRDFHVVFSTDIDEFSILLIIKVVLFTVSGLLEQAAQGERPARAGRSG